MKDRIGAYRVKGEVGRGGMGVVYLAVDERLDREVAIKSLPELLASDPLRLERFEREAKALASLNHPNLAGIYGVEEDAGSRYLILEYVEGETLAERLDRGALAMDEAVEFAIQIAAGVEAAHDAGIVHRDLKPANVKVTPDGQIKVLDFGLARVEDGQTSSMSEQTTLAQPQHSPTVEGVILGTAPYMSPEQARGRKVDKRTDVWSFGVLLYEMLTGSGPFLGETASDSIGAVLHKDVDFALLPASTPLGVRRVLGRCLERDKSQRYRDIGDIRIELASAMGEEPATATTSTGAPVALLIAVAVLLPVVGAGAWFGSRATAPVEPEFVRKLDLVVEREGLEIGQIPPQISPDGLSVAFVNDGRVFLRHLDSFEATPVAGTEGAKSVFWSPDSSWVVFRTESAVLKVPARGGGVTELTRRGDIETLEGAAWGVGDNVLLVDYAKGIGRIPARGGSLVTLLQSDKETEVDFHGVAAIPGTDVLLVLVHRRDDRMEIDAVRGDQRVSLVQMGDEPITDVTWSPTGHILFTMGFAPQGVWAVAFDPDSMQTQGEPFQVASDASGPSVSDDGTLAIRRGSPNYGGEIVWVGLDGIVEPIGATADSIYGVHASRDGTKIAFTSGVTPAKGDVWVRDVRRGVNTRITFFDTFCAIAGWSADGSEIAVVRYSPTAEVQLQTYFFASNGTGQTRDPVPGAMFALDRDWEWAAVTRDVMSAPGSAYKIEAVRVAEPEESTVVVEQEKATQGFKISPDGSLLIYTNRDSGTQELFCTRFPGGEGRWQITSDGVDGPFAWSPEGDTICYLNEGELFRVSVEREPSLVFGRPEKVLDLASADLVRSFTLSFGPTGDRLVMVRDDDDMAEPAAISIIENWIEPYRAD